MPVIINNNKLAKIIFLKNNLITLEEAASIEVMSDQSGENFEETLLNSGTLSEKDYYNCISNYLNIPYITAEEFPNEPYTIPEISSKFLKQNFIFPLKIEDNVLHVAVRNPFDTDIVDNLSLVTGYEIKIYLASEEDIGERLEAHYGSGSMEKIIEDIDQEELELISVDEDEDVGHLMDMAREAPVIRLVNLLIARAVETGASDIHIEPFEDKLKVRYRVDGVLFDAESPPRSLQAAVISRVKIMAELNIAERRLPQDGRIKLKVARKKVDFRVSTIPTQYGESVVMRILDRASAFYSLTELGFPVKTQSKFEHLIKLPHGIILITGPTGSGKTTTLYAALDKINTVDKKIITIENPVEYELSGINQIQVKPSIGLTFANGLRSIVRQDPDIIMVGEIRDSETAEIAVQSALTGHLVFSTLHTNDAASAITRLQDMGVESFLVSSVIEGIMAQRLVRVLCKNCREPYEFTPKMQENLGVRDKISDNIILYKEKGCENCKFTGYKGRSGIYELLMISDDIRKLVLEKAPANIIKQTAMSKGMFTLREDGWEKVKKGLTSLEEIFRVTQEEFVEIAI
ncbi:type II secretion system ATPase GspE [bacterium]|nr:type II secretion system ATPase GspE [bacterium]